MDPKKKVLITAVLLVVVAGGFWLITRAVTNYTGYSIAEIEDIEEFAKCLSEKDILVYLNSEFSNYGKQIMIFGTSFEHLNVIDCSKEIERCLEDEVTQVPTWIINNERILGVQSLKNLADLSGCSLSR